MNRRRCRGRHPAAISPRLQTLYITAGGYRISVFPHFEVKVIVFAEFKQRSAAYFSDSISPGNDLTQLDKVIACQIAVD